MGDLVQVNVRIGQQQTVNRHRYHGITDLNFAFKGPYTLQTKQQRFL